MATKKSAPKQEFKIIKKTKKPLVKKPDNKTTLEVNEILAVKSPRKIKLAVHKSFRLSKRIKHYHEPVSGPVKLTKKTFKPFIARWRLFLGIFIVYLVLDMLFVHGLNGGIDFSILKKSIQDNNVANQSKFTTATTIFGYILSSNGGTTADTGVFQTVLIILISLAIIWSLRQINFSPKIKIRDAFYKSTDQFIPFVLVLIVVVLQLIPILIANWIITNVIGGGIAVSALERFLAYTLSGLLTLLSFYMLCSSLFAVYIVSLPEMTPFRALKGARKVVVHRRWMLMRKILFLLLLLLLIGSVILLPIIMYLPSAAQWTYFILSLLIPFVIHSYMYSLYRELL